MKFFPAIETIRRGKKGYVFRMGKLGIGYYTDTYIQSDLSVKMEYVDPIILKYQNEKGQLPPDYPHLGIQTLADPQHRCRNFGKEIIALARAPMKDSLLTEVQALRIIKAFKYWYRQSRVREEVITQMKIYVPLMHMCADHSKCEIEWCYFLKTQLKGAMY